MSKMWLDSRRISGWVLEWCYSQDNVKENKYLIQFITYPYHAFLYCMYIGSSQQIKNRLKNTTAYLYCRDIENDPNVKNRIYDSHTAYYYCLNVKDDPEVRKNITDPYDAWLYCKHIKFDPNLMSLFNNTKY